MELTSWRGGERGQRRGGGERREGERRGGGERGEGEVEGEEEGERRGGGERVERGINAQMLIGEGRKTEGERREGGRGCPAMLTFGNSTFSPSSCWKTTVCLSG